MFADCVFIYWQVLGGELVSEICGSLLESRSDLPGTISVLIAVLLEYYPQNN